MFKVTDYDGKEWLLARQMFLCLCCKKEIIQNKAQVKSQVSKCPTLSTQVAHLCPEDPGKPWGAWAQTNLTWVWECEGICTAAGQGRQQRLKSGWRKRKVWMSQRRSRAGGPSKAPLVVWTPGRRERRQRRWATSRCSLPSHSGYHQNPRTRRSSLQNLEALSWWGDSVYVK